MKNRRKQALNHIDPVKLGIKGADFWEEKLKESNSKGKKNIKEKQSETEKTVHF